MNEIIFEQLVWVFPVPEVWSHSRKKKLVEKCGHKKDNKIDVSDNVEDCHTLLDLCKKLWEYIFVVVKYRRGVGWVMFEKYFNFIPVLWIYSTDTWDEDLTIFHLL